MAVPTPDQSTEPIEVQLVALRSSVNSIRNDFEQHGGVQGQIIRGMFDEAREQMRTERGTVMQERERTLSS